MRNPIVVVEVRPGDGGGRDGGVVGEMGCIVAKVYLVWVGLPVRKGFGVAEVRTRVPGGKKFVVTSIKLSSAE